MHNNWNETTLGEIAELVIGRTPSRSEKKYWTDDLTFPFCSIADMNSKWINPKREGVTQKAINDGKARLVAAGSLLMSFKLTLGRVGFADVDLFTNEAIVAIHTDPGKAMKEFLYFVLGSQDLTHGSVRAIKGATLNSKSLAAIPILLPSLPEQMRIVDLMTSVDEYIAAISSSVSDLSFKSDVLNSARKLKWALLSDLLSGNHEIPESYDSILEAI
jgi:type I restriction enzyme S subunit